MFTKNGNRPVSFRLKQQNSLNGKVALIVCDREEAVRALAIGLAEKGVDIALACVVEPCKNLVKDEVEAKGRRFMGLGGRINSATVIGQVIQMFGHLDLFIDCSTIDRKKKSIEKGGREAGKPSSAQNIEVFANSNLTRAALHALAS